MNVDNDNLVTQPILEYQMCILEFDNDKISTSCMEYSIVKISDIFIVKIVEFFYTKSWEIYKVCDIEFVIVSDHFM